MLNNFNEINCENSFSSFGVETINWFICYQLFVKYIPISEFPSSSRDLSFSIKDSSKIIELINLLNSYKSDLLKKSFMFDFFENSKTNITKVGYRFTFQSFNKTLTDQEIDNDIKGIIDSVLLIESVSLPGIK